MADCRGRSDDCGDARPTASLPVEENCSAAAEVLELVGRVFGAAKIDKIEVGVAEIGAGQIDAAEVRLANFLRRPVSLLVVFIHVKARSRPFAGDRASNQPATAGAEMKSALAEVGVRKVGVEEVTPLEARTFDLCAAKTGHT